MGDYINVKEIFGCDVFNDSVMQQRLPKKVYKELKQYEKRLDEEKVYLYFMQNGKSLYTGKELNLNEPENLEIDHIIPYLMMIVWIIRHWY